MRILLVLFISTLLLSCKNNESASLKYKQNALKFAIKKGEKYNAAFEFTNEGGQDLLIKSVDGDCSCTSISFDKESIPPGGSGKIFITYDSNKDSLGPVVKKILVESNTKPILSTLTLMGVITK